MRRSPLHASCTSVPRRATTDFGVRAGLLHAAYHGAPARICDIVRRAGAGYAACECP